MVAVSLFWLCIVGATLSFASSRRVPRSPTNFILFGEPSPYHSHPWYARVYQCDNDGNIYSNTGCGGTVIGERWIMTAAHCIGDGLMKVILGHKDALSIEPHHYYDIQRAIPHECYRYNVRSDDIALLETAEPITFSEHVQPIHLSREFLPVGSSATAIGYGHTEDGVTPDRLLEATGKIMESPFAVNYVNESLIFFGGGKGNVCYGDSGGPLLSKDEKGVAWQYGVANFATGGCLSGRPSGFARVSFYCDWIENITKGEVKCEQPKSKVQTPNPPEVSSKSKKEEGKEAPAPEPGKCIFALKGVCLVRIRKGEIVVG
uniref:Peptidase S1 domain-containing protein n=1 Tax=Steinernema glaseri TaxID=37863 RepID=A0A1I8A2T2_9BILA